MDRMEKEKAIGILQAVKAGTADAFIRKAVIKDALDMSISALEQQEADRWIPVTEGLPEKDGHYLVTLFDETESWTELLYWNTTFGGRWQGLIEDDFSDIGNVSAWMPLPEPYQGER